MGDSPKIAIYGIGFVGKSLVQLADAQGLSIVAAYNRAGEKVGQDIGHLAGLEKDLGIIVQDYDIADYSSLDADIAIVCGPDNLKDCFPIYERFLNAGINVLTLGSEMYQPYWFAPELAKRIEVIAKENNVTFTGSGLWDMTRIWPGLMAAGPCLKIDSIDYLTTTDPARQGIHWFPVVGIGMTIEEYDKKLGRADPGWNGVYQILGVVILQYYGYQIDSVSMRQEPVVFDQPFYCKELDKELPAGVCVGTRVLIDVKSKEGVNAHIQPELRLLRPGEIEHGTWKINGQPDIQIQVVRENTGIVSASTLLNRIPDVLDAEPGIVPIMKLGPLKPTSVYRECGLKPLWQ